MSPLESQPGRISPFIRVLAWILLVFTVLGVAVMAHTIATVKSAESARTAWLSLALILLMSPLWAYAAIKGRAPHWMTANERLEDVDRVFDLQTGTHTPNVNKFDFLAPVGTAVVFGVLLIVMGRRLPIFEGEVGWFAAGIFFLGWLTVVLVLWRNYRSKSKKKDDE